MSQSVSQQQDTQNETPTQAKPGELGVSTLREEYSAMRKKLAQAELQMDKIRFGGSKSSASKQPQESLQQIAISLRQKIEDQCDLDCSGRYQSFRNNDEKRKGLDDVDLSGFCTSAGNSAVPPEPPMENSKPSSERVGGNADVSVATDGYSQGASGAGGGSPGQVVSVDDDGDAASSQSTRSQSPDCAPDILPTKHPGDTSVPCISQPPVPSETLIAAPQETDDILGSCSETTLPDPPGAVPQAVTTTTKRTSSLLNRSLPPSLQRKVRMESMQVCHLLAVRHLEEEIAGLKEGLSNGGLHLDSIVEALTKVCKEHSRLAAEVSTQSTVGIGYPRKNMMEELSQLAWHICELEAQLKKKRLMMESETFNANEGCPARAQQENSSQSEPNVCCVKGSTQQECKDGFQGDISCTTTDPSYVAKECFNTTEDCSPSTEDSSHTEDPSSCAENCHDHSHTNKDHSHCTVDHTPTTRESTHSVCTDVSENHSRAIVPRKGSHDAEPQGTMLMQMVHDNGTKSTVVSGVSTAPGCSTNGHLELGKSEDKPLLKSHYIKEHTQSVSRKTLRQTDQDRRIPDSTLFSLGTMQEESIEAEAVEPSLATSLAAVDALKSDLVRLRQDIAHSIAQDNAALAHHTNKSPASVSTSSSSSSSHHRHTRSHSANYLPKGPSHPPHHHHHRRASSVYPRQKIAPMAGWPEEDPRSLSSEHLNKRASVSSNSLHKPMPSSPLQSDFGPAPSLHGPSHHRSQSWSSPWMTKELPSAYLDSHSAYSDTHSKRYTVHSIQDDYRAFLSDGHARDNGSDVTPHFNTSNNSESGQLHTNSYHVAGPLMNDLPVSNQRSNLLVKSSDDTDPVNSVDLKFTSELFSRVITGPQAEHSGRAGQQVRRLFSRSALERPLLRDTAAIGVGRPSNDWSGMHNIARDCDRQLHLVSSLPESLPTGHGPDTRSNPQVVQRHQEEGYPDHHEDGMRISKPQSHKTVVKQQSYTNSTWKGDGESQTGDSHSSTQKGSGTSLQTDAQRIRGDYLTGVESRHIHRRRHTHDGHMSEHHTSVLWNEVHAYDQYNNGYSLELDLSNACLQAEKLGERCERMKRTLDKELSTRR